MLRLWFLQLRMSIVQTQPSAAKLVQRQKH